jgi:hypothetical protein
MTVEPYVSHAMIREFGAEKVNLKSENVTEYREQLARLQTNLKKHIDEHPDYGFVKSRRSGSVAKGTALSSVNDMDLAVYVESEEAGDWGESQLLNWLEQRLKDALKPYGLKDDQFEQQGHCVTIVYRGSGLNVDAVPVIYEDEDDDIGYLITKDTGRRVRTSVTQHLQFIRARKSAHPTDFAQLVRLCKWWVRQERRREEDFRFKSFMVELIWAQLADEGADLSDYPRALERFFGYIVQSRLSERIAFTDFYSLDELPAPSSAPIEIFDPVNPENNIAARYTVTQSESIVAAAQKAFDAVTEAAYAEGKGRAVDLWKTVLGPSFRGDS